MLVNYGPGYIIHSQTRNEVKSPGNPWKELGWWVAQRKIGIQINERWMNNTGQPK